MRRAAWINGKRKLTGSYEYFRAADRFRIVLDSRDRITGQQRVIVTAGSQADKPEWGNWKLVDEAAELARGLK